MGVVQNLGTGWMDTEPGVFVSSDMDYKRVETMLSADDIVFSEHVFGDRVLWLAHFVVMGIRLEVSHMMSVSAYSIMRIEPDGSRDYYLQHSLQDVANVINTFLSRHE